MNYIEMIITEMYRDDYVAEENHCDVYYGSNIIA